MFDKIIKFFLVFLVVTCAVYLLNQYFSVGFGEENYWDHHGFLFLISIAAFPRLTLLFSSVVSGGFVWWFGWLFAPRLLVAALATLAYWQKNPMLVVMAWLVAIGGESSEKFIVVQRSQKTSRRRHNHDIIDIKPLKNSNDD